MAEKRRKAKSKGERERDTQLNAELENEKERQEAPSVISAKKQRKATEWERPETLGEPQTPREHFMQRPVHKGQGMNLTKAEDIKKCWSFSGPEPGGPESKREKEADIPCFTRKANRVLFLGLVLLHVGTRRPLKWVKAQCTFSRGA